MSKQKKVKRGQVERLNVPSVGPRSCTITVLDTPPFGSVQRPTRKPAHSGTASRGQSRTSRTRPRFARFAVRAGGFLRRGPSKNRSVRRTTCARRTLPDESLKGTARSLDERTDTPAQRRRDRPSAWGHQALGANSRRRPDFPEPYAWTAAAAGPMRLWLQEDVDRYVELVREPELARRR